MRADIKRSIAIAAMAIALVLRVGFTAEVDDRTRLAAAIAALEAALEDNVSRTAEIRGRLAELAAGVEAGTAVRELIDAEPRPRMVELLTANLEALNSAGADLRVAEARALRAEGLTIDAVAERFGVTRQRISALLRQRTPA